jgi:hypothetical protein
VTANLHRPQICPGVCRDQNEREIPDGNDEGDKVLTAGEMNAIKFIDYVTEKFPFCIHTIRTDRGHEVQAQFHWHVEDKGIRHVYIRPQSPELNGKMERSHLSDQEEFYQPSVIAMMWIWR